jgi:mannose-6-phosphate isomerase-like protein (cupin superfamily)
MVANDMPRRVYHHLAVSQLPSFQDFTTEQRTIGCDEVLERRWQPDAKADTHTHPFSVRALVVQGDMWLTVGESIRHLRPGDRFELDRGVPHAERYGAEGATYWVARTNHR